MWLKVEENLLQYRRKNNLNLIKKYFDIILKHHTMFRIIYNYILKRKKRFWRGICIQKINFEEAIIVCFFLLFFPFPQTILNSQGMYSLFFIELQRWQVKNFNTTHSKPVLQLYKYKVGERILCCGYSQRQQVQLLLN